MHIRVNGQSLYYRAEGDGKPVVLIHGNNGSHEDLADIQMYLAQCGYDVYALDSRGQGFNPPVDEYHYADMAEDTWCFIQKLELDHPAVFGWSDGGNIALLMESTHPGTCGLLATSGANINPHGLGTHLLNEMKRTNNPSPLYQMMIYEPKMRLTDLHHIQCPSLICAGEHDIIPEWHTRDIAAHITNGHELIIPGADHGSHIMHCTDMAQILLSFFRTNGY